MTPAAPAPPPAGLCAGCRHRRLVRNTRGSTFSLCRRAAWDPALDRYPRLPVRACHGREPHPETRAAPSTVDRDS